MTNHTTTLQDKLTRLSSIHHVVTSKQDELSPDEIAVLYQEAKTIHTSLSQRINAALQLFEK